MAAGAEPAPSCRPLQGWLLAPRPWAPCRSAPVLAMESGSGCMRGDEWCRKISSLWGSRTAAATAQPWRAVHAPPRAHLERALRELLDLLSLPLLLLVLVELVDPLDRDDEPDEEPLDRDDAMAPRAVP